MPDRTLRGAVGEILGICPQLSSC